MQAAHRVLYQSKDLQNFLEASEDEWAMDMARANHETSGGNPAQKTLNNTLAKLKLFGQQTVAGGGKHADEEEDPEYLKVILPKGLLVAFANHDGAQASHQCIA